MVMPLVTEMAKASMERLSPVKIAKSMEVFSFG